MDSIERQLNVKIPRKIKVPTYQFTDYFEGFEKVEAVRQIFGEKTEEVLRNLKVEFGGRRGYMGVSDVDGHIMISAYYINTGDLVDIYLDIIHELVHVRQFMEGKQLFDNNFRYVERPTEVEAYRHSVNEARRLGLNDERILDYLQTEWMTEDDLKQLAQALDVKWSNVETSAKDRRRL